MNVYLLVGVPGSGKSTFTKKYLSDYIRISQDANNGNKEITKKQAANALEQGKNIVIDRCNMTYKQRAEWIRLALQSGVKAIHCVVLDIDPEEALARIIIRKNHETISEQMSIDDKRQIVYRFYNSFETPLLDEGFTSIVYVRG